MAFWQHALLSMGFDVCRGQKQVFLALYNIYAENEAYPHCMPKV